MLHKSEDFFYSGKDEINVLIHFIPDKRSFQM